LSILVTIDQPEKIIMVILWFFCSFSKFKHYWNLLTSFEIVDLLQEDHALQSLCVLNKCSSTLPGHFEPKIISNNKFWSPIEASLLLLVFWDEITHHPLLIVLAIIDGSWLIILLKTNEKWIFTQIKPTFRLLE
jgi:hypothetical protein